MSWKLIYILSGLAFLPVLLIAVIVSIRVTVVIEHYHCVTASSGITARDLVERVARENNLQLRVEVASAGMGDHYDPRDKTIRLTGKVIDSTSVSALAIAAHECGHALQDAQGYAFLKIRQRVIRVSNFSSQLLTPLIFVSLIASMFTSGMASASCFEYMLLAFCVIYGLSALAELITLPTEFNASRRGKMLLESMFLIEGYKEKRAVKRVLGAAASTYVVSFAMSMLYFLRYLSYFLVLLERKRN